jgi:hypothetical protein
MGRWVIYPDDDNDYNDVPVDSHLGCFSSSRLTSVSRDKRQNYFLLYASY